MKVVYSKAIFVEIVEISSYLAENSYDTALRFFECCDESFRLLSREPNIGVIRHFRIPELREVRMWRVKDFENYLIFYRVQSANIKILHVVHAARNYPSLFDVEE